ncbi:MAG: DUF2971 domain-containing protein [Pseudomonas sp.]|uniref:DUF2971 domain-containing protein n=1 Tax=Pseudomonas TaxID=286 RepID=UPI00130EA863|nr:DUF2971 domain-containing protein [Pseudomonas sp. VLB120]
MRNLTRNKISQALLGNAHQQSTVIRQPKGVSSLILYKYYDAAGGRAALRSRRLGFRTPSKFNDPFELTALSNGDGPLSKMDTLRNQIVQLKDQVVILSLTRSPLNPLMWAHYGREHTGVVIAYDVSGPFLSSQEYNLIPADIGDVIYTHTKSPFKMTPETMSTLGRVHRQGFGAPATQTFEQQALARRLFLTKHASWVYEEEVRVVKIADSLFEETHVFQADRLRAYDTGNPLPQGLHLYKKEVPITAVYLGVKNTLASDPVARRELESLDCPIHQLGVDDASWNLATSQLLF